MDLNWTTDTLSSSSLYFNKNVGVRVVVAITCFLAMLGSLFVILSYVCLKNFRSQARQILVNLSFMDFGIALMNVTGILIDFDRFYISYNATTGQYTEIKDVDKVANVVCEVQAVLAHFVTIASVLWTISLAVYMFILIFQNQLYAKYYVPVCYFISYGIPALLSVWITVTKRAGYSPYNSAGWCTVVVNKLLPGGSIKTDYMVITIGYDLWIYLAIIVTVAVYAALFLRLRLWFNEAKRVVGPQNYWKKALNFLDYKLVLIPIAFVLLRMWSCIINILFTYIGIKPDSLPSWVSYSLIYLSGIGDSGQGFANGLLFVFFTKEVFMRMFVHSALGKLLRFSDRDQFTEITVHETSSQSEASLLLGKNFNQEKRNRGTSLFNNTAP